MKTIETTNGFTVMVDDDDYEFLNRHIWYYREGKYVTTVMSSVSVYMHRLIYGRLPNGCVVDHKDRNTLNNQKSNLRKATNKQNMYNRTGATSVNTTSQYVGVKRLQLVSGDISWKCVTSVNNKDIHIGTAKVEEDAAWLRDAFVYKLRGEFSYLNFPDNIPQYEAWEPPTRLLKHLR